MNEILNSGVSKASDGQYGVDSPQTPLRPKETYAPSKAKVIYLNEDGGKSTESRYFNIFEADESARDFLSKKSFGIADDGTLYSTGIQRPKRDPRESISDYVKRRDKEATTGLDVLYKKMKQRMNDKTMDRLNSHIKRGAWIPSTNYTDSDIETGSTEEINEAIISADSRNTGPDVKKIIEKGIIPKTPSGGYSGKDRIKDLMSEYLQKTYSPQWTTGKERRETFKQQEPETIIDAEYRVICKTTPKLLGAINDSIPLLQEQKPKFKSIKLGSGTSPETNGKDIIYFPETCESSYKSLLKKHGTAGKYKEDFSDWKDSRGN